MLQHGVAIREAVPRLPRLLLAPHVPLLLLVRLCLLGGRRAIGWVTACPALTGSTSAIGHRSSLLLPLALPLLRHLLLLVFWNGAHPLLVLGVNLLEPFSQALLLAGQTSAGGLELIDLLGRDLPHPRLREVQRPVVLVRGHYGRDMTRSCA